MFRCSSLGQCCCSITRAHTCILRPLYERTDNVGSRNDVACSRYRSCLPHDLSFGSVLCTTSRPVVPLKAARQRTCIPETVLRRRASSDIRFIRSYHVFAGSRPGVVAKQLTAPEGWTCRSVVSPSRRSAVSSETHEPTAQQRAPLLRDA